MKFTKMHGAGNDYIYVDCFAQPTPERLADLAEAVSDRNFGIGGDGLVLISPTDGDADAEMIMFNADGSRAEMCGNAIRCVAKYLYDHGIVRKDRMQIQSMDQLLALELSLAAGKVDRVRVDMGAPILEPARIPTTLMGDPVADVPLAVGERSLQVTCVSMGNPHCVVFVEQATDELVLGVGPMIEQDAHFPNRVNAEFVEVVNRHELNQRTWERGSGETLACGTGAAAVCVAGVLTGRCEREITIHLRGGDLQLHWNETDNHVYKTGPATEVFSGDWPWDQS